MKREKLYLSTVCADAAKLAEKHGLGLEIAEYCTAMNMDRYFETSHALVTEQMRSTGRFVFHAPFNELCPAAIDPLVVDITKRRFHQALELSLSYGIKKIVVHSGYVPLVYHKSWFRDRSVEFWSEFIKTVPDGIELCLENVMEDSADLLYGIVRDVGDRRFGLCLDVGHANTKISDISPVIWAEQCLPLLKHVHLHNNMGDMDLHDPVGTGTIDIAKVLDVLSQVDITYTIESLDAKTSIEWLVENGRLE